MRFKGALGYQTPLGLEFDGDFALYYSTLEHLILNKYLKRTLVVQFPVFRIDL
jgi:hypothetical protein